MYLVGFRKRISAAAINRARYVLGFERIPMCDKLRFAVYKSRPGIFRFYRGHGVMVYFSIGVVFTI